MQIVQNGVGYNLDHCNGSCHCEITTYDPGYEEGGETASHSPGYGFDYTAEMAVIQLQQHLPLCACTLHGPHSTSVCHPPLAIHCSPIWRRISVPDMLVMASSNFSSAMV
jgi:hypothetical protein